MLGIVKVELAKKAMPWRQKAWIGLAWLGLAWLGLDWVGLAKKNKKVGAVFG